MIALLASLLLFVGLQLVPAVPSIKQQYKDMLGKAYGPVFGIASAVLLAFSIWAVRSTNWPIFYSPPPWGWKANFILTLVAFLFVGIFLFRGSWRNAISYPLSVAALFWGLGHVLANGGTGEVIFVLGIMAAVLLPDIMKATNARLAKSEERAGHNFLSIIFGVALYGLFAQLHGVIVGVPVLQLQP
jgi:uncharacterized membrane protein